MNYFVIIYLATIFSMVNVNPQLNSVYEEVDHVLWVVKDLKSVKKGWEALGFTEIEELKKAKLEKHGFRADKGSVKAVFGHLGGVNALWIQPTREGSILSRHLEEHGEGAIALIHKVESESQLLDITQSLARANIGKIATYTIHTSTGNLRYTIMDTMESGKYYLGFVIDTRTSEATYTGKNKLGMKFNQYAFAIQDEGSVSDYWVSAGLPQLEITHGEVWDKMYFGKSSDFDMKLGWQRHGSVVYEWCIPIKPPTVYADHIRMHGEGIQHFGFNVDDIDEAIKFFEEKNYKVSMSGGWGIKGQKGSGRFAYIDLNKIGGMTVELLWNYKE
jgi:4-hydroxyphenylpyruvate dioxygenase-like putative hemolysin